MLTRLLLWARKFPAVNGTIWRSENFCKSRHATEEHRCGERVMCSVNEGKYAVLGMDVLIRLLSRCVRYLAEFAKLRKVTTVIPRLTKIIRSGITFVSRNVISRKFL